MESTHAELSSSRLETKELEPIVASIVTDWTTNNLVLENFVLRPENIYHGVNDIGIIYQY